MAVTEWGNKTKIDDKYYECWQPLKKHFNESNAEGEIFLHTCRLLQIMTNLSVEANSVDPDQTAPIRAV